MAAPRTQRTTFTEEEQQKFQRFFDLAEGDEMELEEQCDLYDQYFPTRSEAGAYNDWFHFNHWDRIRPASPAPISAPPLETYRSLLANTDFRDQDAVAGVNALLTRGFHPHIPVGYINGTETRLFRLMPRTNWLQPTKEMNWKHGSDKVVVPPMILGINHTVHHHKFRCIEKEACDAIGRYLNDPDRPDPEDEEVPEDDGEYYDYFLSRVERFSTPGNRFGKYGSQAQTADQPEGKYGGPTQGADQPQSSGEIDYTSESAWEGVTLPLDDVSAPQHDRGYRKARTDESTRTGDSDTPNDETGFAFFQLGALQYCSSSPAISTIDQTISPKKLWISSELILVAEIGYYGKLGAIWALANFWPDDDSDWTPPLSLPGVSQYTTGAKIADSFDQLGPDFEIKIPKEGPLCLIDDFELVGCFRLPNEDGRIVRQWVVDAASPQGSGA